jgi:hypothetical protein
MHVSIYVKWQNPLVLQNRQQVDVRQCLLPRADLAPRGYLRIWPVPFTQSCRAIIVTNTVVLPIAMDDPYAFDSLAFLRDNYRDVNDQRANYYSRSLHHAFEGLKHREDLDFGSGPIPS